jgi:hypothetical protein
MPNLNRRREKLNQHHGVLEPFPRVVFFARRGRRAEEADMKGVSYAGGKL